MSRYLLDPAECPKRPKPLSGSDFRECLRILHVAMRRHNEEAERLNPPNHKPLIYLY